MIAPAIFTTSSGSSVTGSALGKNTEPTSNKATSSFLRARLRARLSKILLSNVVRTRGYSSESGFMIGTALRSGLSCGMFNLLNVSSLVKAKEIVS